MKTCIEIFIRLIGFILYIFLVAYIDKDIHYNDWYNFPFKLGSVLIGLFYIVVSVSILNKKYS